MCGPTESILGRSIEPVVNRFRTSMPAQFPIARGPVKIHGALIEIDENTGKAISIKRIAEVHHCEYDRDGN